MTAALSAFSVSERSSRRNGRAVRGLTWWRGWRWVVCLTDHTADMDVRRKTGPAAWMPSGDDCHGSGERRPASKADGVCSVQALRAVVQRAVAGVHRCRRHRAVRATRKAEAKEGSGGIELESGVASRQTRQWTLFMGRQATVGRNAGSGSASPASRDEGG